MSDMTGMIKYFFQKTRQWTLILATGFMKPRLYDIVIPDNLTGTDSSYNELMLHFAFENDSNFYGVFTHISDSRMQRMCEKWNWLVLQAWHGNSECYRLRLEKFAEGILGRNPFDWTRMAGYFSSQFFFRNDIDCKGVFGKIDRIGLVEFLCNDECELKQNERTRQWIASNWERL